MAMLTRNQLVDSASKILNYFQENRSKDIIISENLGNITSIYESMIDIWNGDQRKKVKLSIKNRLRIPRLLYMSSRILKNYNEDEAKLVWNIYNLDQKAHEDMVFVESIGTYLDKHKNLKFDLILTMMGLILYNELEKKIYKRIELNGIIKVKKIDEKQIMIYFVKFKDNVKVFNILIRCL